MEEGPTSGTTRNPSRCAASTSLAPGSAIAGQPASDSRPSGRFSRKGCSRGATSSPISHDVQVADAACPTSPRNARALLAFSTAKSRSDVTVCSADGAQRVARRRRRAASGWRTGSRQDRQPGALEHLGERDQRQADERGRVVGFDALRSARCRGLRPWRCRRSRRAARGAGRLRSAASVSWRKTTRQGTTRDCSRIACGIEKRHGGVEVGRLAAQAAQLARPRWRGCRACRSARRRRRRPGRSR